MMVVASTKTACLSPTTRPAGYSMMAVGGAAFVSGLIWLGYNAVPQPAILLATSSQRISILPERVTPLLRDTHLRSTSDTVPPLLLASCRRKWSGHAPFVSTVLCPLCS
jgi:hypothetical protein